MQAANSFANARRCEEGQGQLETARVAVVATCLDVADEALVREAVESWRRDLQPQFPHLAICSIEAVNARRYRDPAVDRVQQAIVAAARSIIDQPSEVPKRFLDVEESLVSDFANRNVVSSSAFCSWLLPQADANAVAATRFLFEVVWLSCGVPVDCKLSPRQWGPRALHV